MKDAMVLIVNGDAAVPVFHEFGNFPTMEHFHRGQFVAKCGATTSPWGQIRLRRAHAEKIGRPCKRCDR